MAYAHPRDLQTEIIIDNLLKEMPPFVNDFRLYKERNNGSPYSMQKYLYIFRHFFTWLIKEQIVEVETIKDISLKDLEELPLLSIELYLDEVRESKMQIKSKNVVKKRNLKTVANVISSLKSLFNFLAKKSEDSESKQTYLERDVMAKVPIPIKKETAQFRANRFSKHLIAGEDFLKLYHYLEFEYEQTLNSRQSIATFKRDLRRDLALIVLMLSTGIRVSECANILIDDINFKTQTVDITRKGNKEDTIYLPETALEKLQDFLAVRNQNYPGADSCPYLFCTSYDKKGKQITVRAIENLVRKYTAAFRGDKGISPHKLRHSFAVNYIQNGGHLSDLRDLLGHTSLEATSLYLNTSNERKFAFLKQIDDDIRKKHRDINNEDEDDNDMDWSNL